MSNLPTPIRLSERRLPQAGRLRMGVKDKRARGGRRAINTWRFTSQDDALLAPVADKYGGTVAEWNDDKSGDRYELISEATVLDVVLPPDPLTEWYELWSGKHGLERRCNGETCDLLTQGPEGGEVARVPCVCFARGKLACTYKLRLSVLLPAVSTLSTWRLDTSSENARMEIPGVVDLVEMAQGRGLYTAKLRLEQRTAPGKRFNVPVLDVGVSAEALMAGDARLSGSLPSGVEEPRREAVGGAGGEASPPPALPPSPDDEIVDAEVLDEVSGIQSIDPTIGRAWLDSLTTHQRNKALVRARELALEMGEPVPTTLAAASPTIVDRLADEFTRNGGNGHVS